MPERPQQALPGQYMSKSIINLNMTNLHSLLDGTQGLSDFKIYWPRSARASFGTKNNQEFSKLQTQIVKTVRFCLFGNIIWKIWKPYCIYIFTASSKHHIMWLEEVGVLQAWQHRSYFIVQILRGTEWDVTIQNKEPPGSTFPGSYTLTSFDLLGALQLIIELPPPLRL